MDDKTLVETFLPYTRTTVWETLGEQMNFSFVHDDEELYDEQGWDMPIAFPRTLKAARQILKEAGWTIVKSGEHS